MEHKGGRRYHHDACYAAAVVDEKVCLGMSAAKSSSEIIALSIVESCLAEGIS